MSSTASDVCNRIKYVTMRTVPVKHYRCRVPYTIVVRDTEQTRKENFMLEMNMRLRGEYPIQCNCSRCRTDGLTE